jgi:hypothetical protein
MKSSKDARKSILGRGRGMMGKIVDGVVEDEELANEETEDGSERNSFDPFVSPSAPASPFTGFLERLISQPRTSGTVPTRADEDALLEERPLRPEYGGIVFTNPFCDSSDAGTANESKERRDSVSVALNHTK